MKKSVFFLIFLFSVSTIYGQDSTSAIKQSTNHRKWQKAFVGIIVGGYGESPYHSRYNPDPENRFLKSGQERISFNKKDFNSSKNTNEGGVFINPYISFRPWNKKRKMYNENQELRLGIIFNSNSGRTINYDNQINDRIQSDTTIISHVSFENKRDDLGLNLGYIGISDIVKYRFSLYSGFDLGVSYSVTHFIVQKVTQSTYGATSYYYNRYDVVYSNDQYKQLNGISSLSIRGSVLFGVNLRIMDPITIFSEGRVGYTYIQPFGNTALMQVYYNMNVGFKIKI